MWLSNVMMVPIGSKNVFVKVPKGFDFAIEEPCFW